MIHVYKTRLPEQIQGFATDQYREGEQSIFINSAASDRDQRRTQYHELLHILREDYNKPVEQLQAIEAEVHSIVDNMTDAEINAALQKYAAMMMDDTCPDILEAMCKENQ